MAMTSLAKVEQAESISRLRELMPKGSTVYTILRHVSASGMSRRISLVIIGEKLSNGEHDIRHPNYHASRVLRWKLHSGFNDSIVVNGCGMDMGFHLVYSLSQAIHDDGNALKHRWL